MDVSLDRLIQAIHAFVVKTRGAPPGPIGPDTLLCQEGHIDSFGLVDLIADLEASLSIQLPSGALIPEDFETPRALWKRIGQL